MMINKTKILRWGEKYPYLSSFIGLSLFPLFVVLSCIICVVIFIRKLGGILFEGVVEMISFITEPFSKEE